MRKSLLLLAALPMAASAQTGAFRVSIVQLSNPVADSLARSYNRKPNQEQLWCVTSYTVQERPEYTLISVTAVDSVPESLRAGKSHVETPVVVCRDPVTQLAQPTIHTHPNGSCQASPADVATILSRMALFDGIQCGDRYTTWQFAKIYDDSLLLEALLKALRTR